jgi:type IV pilus assembly protein PilY1
MTLRFSGPWGLVALLVVICLLQPGRAGAQQTYQEDFTQGSVTLPWYSTGGTCLTAGTLPAAPALQPSTSIIGCVANLAAYYRLQVDEDPILVGGFNGTFPDPVGKGALRFTNGAPYANFERGSLVSGFTFPTSRGISITFNTVTYFGDSGGNGADGADGIGFFLMDACVPLANSTPPAGCSGQYGTGP